MRRWLLILGGVFVVLVILIGVALALFDAEKLRDPLQKQATAALGRDVTLGKISLAIFPLPGGADRRRADRRTQAERSAARADRGAAPARRGAAAAREEGRAARARARLAAHQHPLRQDGKPILPGPAKTAEKPKPERARGEARRPRAPAESAGLALAVGPDRDPRRRRQAGPWKIEHAKIDGHLSLDGSGAFRYSMNLPGLAELRDGEVELAKLTSRRAAGRRARRVRARTSRSSRSASS